MHSFTGRFPSSFYTQVSFEQCNLDSLSMLLCFIHFTELTTDQRIQSTGGSHLEWTHFVCSPNSGRVRGQTKCIMGDWKIDN